MDDQRLLAAITAGDRDAYAVLVEREAAVLFRICYRILGTVGDAEDAVQETFVIAYRAIGTYRGDGPLGAWLARIATRHALRRAGSRRAVVSLDAAAEPLSLPASGPDPLASALAAERGLALRRAVAALGEPYREVVALRFFGELTLDEIATATGRPLGTVKTHLRRGLARLREAIEPGARP